MWNLIFDAQDSLGLYLMKYRVCGLVSILKFEGLQM